MLVISQSFIDGDREKLWRANGAFQAVAIPAGEHRVELVFRDPWFRSGAAISLVSLLVAVGIWGGSARHRGREQ